MDWYSTLFRFSLALVFGACVGMERQLHRRTAGLRTNILVSLGAAGFTVLGASIDSPDSMPRIIAQIVSGIGFLGAGAIMREGLTVQGLNTAATVWCSAVIGCISGAGYVMHAALFTGAIVLTNTIFREVEYYMGKGAVAKGHHSVHYIISIQCTADDQEWVRKLLLDRIRKRKLALQLMETQNQADMQMILRATVKHAHGEGDLQQVIEDLSQSPYVLSASWDLAKK